MFSLLRSLCLSRRASGRTAVPDEKPSGGDEPQSLILQLPVDVVVEIADRVPPEDLVALSLSCRSLYNILFPRAKLTLNTRQKGDLLLRLERDLGGTHSFCSFCFKLYDYSHGRRRWHYEPDYPCDWEAGSFHPLLHWAPYSLRLDYHTARRMITNHTFETSHGITLDKFCRASPDWVSAFFKATRHPVWCVNVEGRFIQEGLLLKVTRSITALRLNWILDNWVVANYSICCHMAILGADSPAASSYSGAQDVVSEGNLTSYTTKGCAKCNTDWELGFENGNDLWLPGGTATVQPYHLVGKVSSHLDPDWLYLVGRGYRVAGGAHLRRLGEIKALWEAG